MLSTWHTCPGTEWYITHIPFRSELTERVSYNTAILAPAQAGVGQNITAISSITDIHSERSYEQEGINLWYFHRPLSSNKKHCFLCCFPFFLLSACLTGSYTAQNCLVQNWDSIVLRTILSFPGFDISHEPESQFILERMGSTIFTIF